MNFDHSHPAIIKQIRPTEYWARLSERTDLLQMHELIKAALGQVKECVADALGKSQSNMFQ